MKLTAAVGERAYPLRETEDLDPLLERIGDAHCVLLGEASHGTSEYYTAGQHQRAVDPREGLLLYRRRGGLARLLRGEPVREGLSELRKERPRGAASL